MENSVYNMVAELQYYMALFVIVFVILSTIAIFGSMYVMFKKLHEPGWKALVPAYNLVILCRLIGVSPYLLLFCVFPAIIRVAESNSSAFSQFSQGLFIYPISLLASLIGQFSILNSLRKKFSCSRWYLVGSYIAPIVFFPLIARSTPQN